MRSVRVQNGTARRALSTAEAVIPPIWSRQRRADARLAADLYARIVTQARRPGFYLDLGIPDTVDGRFELVALHAFLVIRRLKGEGDAAGRLAQALFDTMFADMDRALRQMGVGDLGVGKRVKKMVSGFLGRSAAYEAGLESGDASLDAALRRNVYGTVDASDRDAARLSGYMRREAARLDSLDLDQVLAGGLEFGAPPAATPVK